MAEPGDRGHAGEAGAGEGERSGREDPASPPPECPEREGQRFAAERTGVCRGAPFARWPDPGAAAEQAARLLFADLADRLGVSVFDLAGRLGVEGVRGLSRRTVDELAAGLGITPQELVERAEEAAAAILAEEAGKVLPGGASAGLPGLSGALAGKPLRLPDTGPRASVLLHAGVLLSMAGALILLLTRRRLPS